MTLVTGDSRATILMHRSTVHVVACRSSIHAPVAIAVPLTFSGGHLGLAQATLQFFRNLQQRGAGCGNLA
jgi:hypothetical protein